MIMLILSKAKQVTKSKFKKIVIKFLPYRGKFFHDYSKDNCCYHTKYKFHGSHFWDSLKKKKRRKFGILSLMFTF